MESEKKIVKILIKDEVLSKSDSLKKCPSESKEDIFNAILSKKYETIYIKGENDLNAVWIIKGKSCYVSLELREHPSRRSIDEYKLDLPIKHMGIYPDSYISNDVKHVLFVRKENGDLYFDLERLTQKMNLMITKINDKLK